MTTHTPSHTSRPRLVLLALFCVAAATLVTAGIVLVARQHRADSADAEWRAEQSAAVLAATTTDPTTPDPTTTVLASSTTSTTTTPRRPASTTTTVPAPLPTLPEPTSGRIATTSTTPTVEQPAATPPSTTAPPTAAATPAAATTAPSWWYTISSPHLNTFVYQAATGDDIEASIDAGYAAALPGSIPGWQADKVGGNHTATMHRTSHGGIGRYLDRFQPGDQITFTFFEGSVLTWTVTSVDIVPDTEKGAWIDPWNTVDAGPTLRLFACSCEDGSPGCVSHRVFVTATLNT